MFLLILNMLGTLLNTVNFDKTLTQDTQTSTHRSIVIMLGQYRSSIVHGQQSRQSILITMPTGQRDSTVNTHGTLRNTPNCVQRLTLITRGQLLTLLINNHWSIVQSIVNTHGTLQNIVVCKVTSTVNTTTRGHRTTSSMLV